MPGRDKILFDNRSQWVQGPVGHIPVVVATPKCPCWPNIQINNGYTNTHSAGRKLTDGSS